MLSCPGPASTAARLPGFTCHQAPTTAVSVSCLAATCWSSTCQTAACSSGQAARAWACCTAAQHSRSLFWFGLLYSTAWQPARPLQMPPAAAQLRSLSLAYARLPEQPGRDSSQALEHRLLPHLTALTSLELSSVTHSLESCFLQHISTISLKHLSVEGNGEGLSLLPGQYGTGSCLLLCVAVSRCSRVCQLGWH
jgi:hypothetical protein